MKYSILNKIYGLRKLNNDDDFNDDEFYEDDYDSDEVYKKTHDKNTYQESNQQDAEENYEENMKHFINNLKNVFLVLLGGFALFLILKRKMEIGIPLMSVTISFSFIKIFNSIFYQENNVTEMKKDAYREYLINNLINKNEKDDKHLLEGAVADNRDIIDLMLKNNDEITEYF